MAMTEHFDRLGITDEKLEQHYRWFTTKDYASRINDIEQFEVRTKGNVHGIYIDMNMINPGKNSAKELYTEWKDAKKNGDIVEMYHAKLLLALAFLSPNVPEEEWEGLRQEWLELFEKRNKQRAARGEPTEEYKEEPYDFFK